MSVTILDKYHLSGLHSDTKPTTGIPGGIALGAVFWEYDTGDTYEWDGASWRQQVNETNLVSSAGVDAGILAPDTYKDIASVDMTSIATVWTPATGKKVRLMGGQFSSNTAVSYLFEDNAHPGTVWRTPKLLIDAPYSFDLGKGFLLSAANNVLKMTGAGVVTGALYGREE